MSIFSKETHKEERRVITTLGIVLVFILALFIAMLTINEMKNFQYIGEDIPAQNTISVTGEGEMFAVPDVATFTFGATAQAQTVSAAQEEVTTIIDNALQNLKDEGIEDKDIKTVGYNVFPRYQEVERSSVSGGVGSQGSEGQTIRPPEPTPTDREIVGYEVDQRISVKVREVENAGELLGLLGDTEVTNVSSLRLTIDDETEIQRQARQKAIEDAKMQARILAHDLGVELEEIVNFSESGNRPIFFDASRRESQVASSEAASTPSIPQGENRITSEVSITYEID